jgi:DNA-binding NarL/FixJ family response regulator
VWHPPASLKGPPHASPGAEPHDTRTVEDGDSIFSALRAGARGYLLKESGPEELVRAVHAVASGEFITSPGVACRISNFIATTDAEAREAGLGGARRS